MTVTTDTSKTAFNMPFSRPVTAPPAETAGGVGSDPAVPYADHSHPSPNSGGIVTMDSTGIATFTYSKPFLNRPLVFCTAYNPLPGKPIIAERIEDIMTAGMYTGCKIRASRSQSLPAQQQLSVLAILGAVITGINAVAGLLNNFDVFGASVTGAEISVIAIKIPNTPNPT